MYILACCSILGLLLAASSFVQASVPATIPLAARSPYLLNFLLTSTPYSRTWQTGFSGNVQGWVGLIRVDGAAYAWMGDISAMPKTPTIDDTAVNSQTLTPTRSVFSLQAGPMQLTVTFLSPIEPGNLVNQSIPASYVALEASTSDGSPHAVQVYTDISAEWVTGDRSQNVTWTTNVTSSGTLVHSVAAAKQTPYNEFGDQSTWGTIYYATRQDVNVTFKTASDINSRSYFTTNGALDNAQNNTFRSITDEYPVFAFAHDLGTIQQTPSPLVWAVANVRDSDSTGVLTYKDLSQRTQTRNLYYRSQYTDDHILLDDFLNDHAAASNRSKALDEELMQLAMTLGGTEYVDIISLATRQAYCGIEVTVGRNGDGSVNASDLMVFYKDTGLPQDKGIPSHVSPVDGLLSAFPMFLHIDHTIGGALLEPLLRFQNDEAYTNAYAALDLGAMYPVAVASGEGHQKGIEASAAMIIMAYGHAKASGNSSIVERYYALLERWGQFLYSNIPAAGGNLESDTALKGIIAVQAMSSISALVGDSTNRDSFSSHASAMYSNWLRQALASDGHIRFHYGDTDDSIDAQVTYIADAMQHFGVATNSTNTSVVAANWNMLAAAVATRNGSVQQSFIHATHEQAFNSALSVQFPLVYTASTGVEIVGKSSPRQGAVYAPLLVNSSSFRAGVNASSTLQHHTGAPVGAIVGGTIGGLAGLSLLAGLFCVFRRRRRSSSKNEVPGQTTILQGDSILHSPAHDGITPFLQTDTSHAMSSDNGSISPENRWPTAVENKRVLAMRRAQQYDQHRVMVASGPAMTSPSSTSRTSRSERSDRSHTETLLREIANLRREITAIRVPADDASDPPEYGDV